MEIDPKQFTGADKETILRELIDHVVKTPEEAKDKQTRGGKSTDLKLYLCDNQGFTFGTLDERIEQIASSDDFDRNAKRFVSEHTFLEDKLSEGISFVQITTPDADRTDDFFFIRNNGYLWILTTERKKWVKKTVENLIKYLPDVERLYLSSDDLEGLVDHLNKAQISGFTARYKAPYRDRDATLVFHGAEEDDLETAQEAFDAEPSRIEFDQANSPATAIQGSYTNDGHTTLESVRQDSEAKALETLLGITEDYQESDRKNFEVENKPSRTIHEDGSFAIDGFTCVELTDPDREEVDTEVLRIELEEDILSAYQYTHGAWGDDTLMVYDEDHEEVFEVALEPPNIILYPKEGTTALSLRSFAQKILDEFDSTYTLTKRTNSVVTAEE